MVSEENKKESELKLENALLLFEKKVKYYKKYGTFYANRNIHKDEEVEELQKFMSYNPFCERNYKYESWKWGGEGEAHYDCDNCLVQSACRLMHGREYDKALEVVDKLKEEHIEG